jgi:hypothetical protein
MLLCLSSGFRLRYRHDIFRAIAMPDGSQLQFRYEKVLVPAGLQAQLASNALEKSDVCIAYLDRADAEKPIEMVPCRAATLTESHLTGDIFVLTLCLKDFWLARDVAAFNRDIRSVAGNLPEWTGAPSPTGVFCQTITAVPTSLVRSSDINDWQQIVRTLKDHSDFADEPFFYYVRSLSKLGKPNDQVSLAKNRYNLGSNASYQLNIVQFSADRRVQDSPMGKTYWILARNDDDQISFTATNEIAVDSPYDEKLVRFRTVSPAYKTDSALTLLRQIEPGLPDTAKAILDFDLHLRVGVNKIWLTFKGLIVGGFIAAQGVVAIYLNQSISDKMAGYGLVTIAGIVAGLVASFGFRKL